MNRNIAEGKWKQLKGLIREKWGDLTDNELDKTEGNIDQIAGKIQSKYGEEIDDVRSVVNGLLKRVNNSL